MQATEADYRHGGLTLDEWEAVWRAEQEMRSVEPTPPQTIVKKPAAPLPEAPIPLSMLEPPPLAPEPPLLAEVTQDPPPAEDPKKERQQLLDNRERLERIRTETQKRNAAQLPILAATRRSRF